MKNKTSKPRLLLVLAFVLGLAQLALIPAALKWEKQVEHEEKVAMQPDLIVKAPPG